MLLILISSIEQIESKLSNRYTVRAMVRSNVTAWV